MRAENRVLSLRGRLRNTAGCLILEGALMLAPEQLGEIDGIDEERREAAVAGRVRDHRAREREQKPRRLHEHQERHQVGRRVLHRHHGGVGQLHHEDRLFLVARMGAQVEHDLEHLGAQAARLHVGGEIDLWRLALGHQGLRRARTLEGQVLEILRIDDQLISRLLSGGRWHAGARAIGGIRLCHSSHSPWTARLVAWKGKAVQRPADRLRKCLRIACDRGGSCLEIPMSFADCLDDPLHRQMYAYWQQKRGARLMPTRAEIDPTEIPRLLPNLLISEYVPEGEAGRWRYRLAGTAVATAFGRNPTGRYIEELTKGDYRAFIERIHRVVRDERRALFCASEYTGPRALLMSAKRLLLPLTTDGRQVDQIITLLVFRLGTGLPAVIELDRTEGTTRHAGPILAEA